MILLLTNLEILQLLMQVHGRIASLPWRKRRKK